MNIYSEEDILLFLSYKFNFYKYRTLIKEVYSNSLFLSDIFSGSMNSSKLGLNDYGKILDIVNLINSAEIESIKLNLEKRKIKFISYVNDEYPKSLKDINDPPMILFCRGNTKKLLEKNMVGIVGTRNCTNYGVKVTSQLSRLLNEKNITVVSGMASGIDSYAHLESLNNGNTIAVLGTGVDFPFPEENRGLYEKIISNEGLIVSENIPETKPYPWNFPQRNRIISALSSVLVVVEGDTQSGALITARFAIKQNKKVFAVPGPLSSNQSNGPNVLIKSKIAELLLMPSDILDEMFLPKQTQINFEQKDERENDNLNNIQKKIYLSMNDEPIKFDNLLINTGLEVSELLKNLSIMEILGLIKKNFDGGYIKV